MKEYFTNIITGGERGLYLCQAPTGSGKTYNICEAFKDHIRNNRDNKKKRKLIYITTLNKNVISKELRAAFGDDKEYDRNVLHIRANFDEAAEKILTMEIPKEFCNEQYKCLLRCVSVYNEQIKRYDNGANIDPNVLAKLKEDAEAAERDFRYSIRKYLIRHIVPESKDEDAKELMLDAIRHIKKYKWIGELYPAVFTDDHPILLMSMSKFLLRNSTLVEPSYMFMDADFIEDAVIIIDEFDSTKEVVLNALIDSALRLNEEYIALFMQVARGLSYSLLSHQMRQAAMAAGGSEYDALIKKAESIISRYRVDLNYKTDEATVNRRTNFLFKDSAYHSFAVDGRQFIRTILKKAENRAVIYIEYKKEYDRHMEEYEEAKKAYDEYVASGADPENGPDEPDRPVLLFSMLREIDSFMMRFNVYLSKWADKYADVVNTGRSPQQVRLTGDNATSSILGHMNISKSGQAIITGHIPAARKNKVPKKDFLPDISYYGMGFRVLDLVDDDSHNEATYMRIFKMGETPESILIYLSQVASVIGISATAQVPTVIGNYDLDHVKDALGDAFHATPQDVIDRVSAEMYKKQVPYRDNSISVEAGIIGAVLPDGDIEKRCRAIFRDQERASLCAGIIKKALEPANNSEYDYYAARYCSIADSMRQFCACSARSMLSLSMSYPRDRYWKYEKSLLKDILEFCCLDCGLKPDAVKLFVLHDHFDKNKAKLLERLSKGEKIYVMSSYKTIGAGQNLQYDIEDMEGLVSLSADDDGSDIRGRQKDFDAVYLGDVTNVVVNMYGAFDKKALMLKIAQVEELLSHGEISRADAYTLLRISMNTYAGERDDNDKDYWDVSYDTESVRMVSTQTIIQAVGRICRAHVKNPEIRIQLDERLAAKLSGAEFDRHILSPELSAVRALLADTETSVSETERIIMNRAENTSYAAMQMLRTLLARGWEAKGMEFWGRLREVTLRYPFASLDKRNEDELIAKLYITSGRKQNSYMYVQAGDYSTIFLDFNMNRALLNNKNRDHLGGEGYVMTMSEENSRLGTVLKYHGMREFFTSRGYACSFEANDYMMSPAIYNNIYKGALGEVAGRFIIENETGLQLKPITEPDKFEFFDFEISPGVYVDFKNWKFTYLERREDIYAEITRKLDQIGGKMAFVVNLVRADAKAVPMTSVDGRIVEVPGLIDNDGNVITEAFDIMRLVRREEEERRGK